MLNPHRIVQQQTLLIIPDVQLVMLDFTLIKDLEIVYLVLTLILHVQLVTTQDIAQHVEEV